MAEVVEASADTAAAKAGQASVGQASVGEVGAAAVETTEVVVRLAVAADVNGFVASSVALFAEDAGDRDDAIDLGCLGMARPASVKAIGDQAAPPRAADPHRGVVGHLTGFLGEATAMRPVRVATLLSLYVRPEYRRVGLGSRLVDEFRSWARRRHMDRIEVTAYASNDGALRFYRRHGFVAQSIVLETTP
jgi:ribosomal protein S18 acetylase RimI-like enzyme